MIDFSKVTITAEMLQIIADIDEFKGSWELLGKIAPDRLTALKKVSIVKSTGSSTRIEGSKLTDEEVEKLLSSIDKNCLQTRDEQEVAGYGFVCEEVFKSFEHMPFTENTIKHLHSWLLKFSEKDEHHKGNYKKIANQIEAFGADGKSLGVIFKTADPFETPMKMQTLISWTNESLNNKTLHPLLVIGIFVLFFLAIHPFQDGNGRLSRILTSLLLLKAGYLYVSFSSLENIIEENKESYYLSLRKTQKTLAQKEDFLPWLTFFLKCLQKQKIYIEEKMKRERKILMLPKLSEEILNLVQEHGHLNITNLFMFTRANRNTLKKHLQNLVKNNHLSKSGKGKATRYFI